jgi:lysophospholipase L1-like esterase
VTTYLLGDSHLAQLGPSVPRLGVDVVNLAVSGAVAQHLEGQLRGVLLPAEARLVLSIGTNDADPSRGLPLPEFGAVVDAFLAVRPGRRWVYVASPGCAADVDRTWTAAGMVRYSARAASAFAAAGAAVLDSPALLAPLGRRAFVEDGVHLSPEGYDALLAAVRNALRARPG